MATPILRSIGLRVHPVGALTIANLFLNPNLELNVSGDISLWDKTNCTFRIDPIHLVGTYSGKMQTTSTTQIPVVSQTIAVQSQVQYVASLGVNIPSTLSAGISMFADIFDPSNSFIATLGGPLVGTATTSGWIRPSMLFAMPVDASTAKFYVTRTVQPTTLDYFYLDALMLELGDTPGVYVDGDMAGYAWQGAQGQSITLKSEFADAFRAFQCWPLSGAGEGSGADENGAIHMGAGAWMFAPQYAPLVS